VFSTHPVHITPVPTRHSSELAPRPAAPLAPPLFRALLPMLLMLLPDTVPVSELLALADEVLNELATDELALPPLLAAAAPAAAGIGRAHVCTPVTCNCRVPAT